MVTLLVGPEQRPFVIHKGRLCKEADWLRSYFYGPFRAGTSGTIDLPHEEEGVVTLFEKWLYDHCLLPEARTILSLGDVVRAQRDLLLVKAYTFANRYSSAGFRNALVNEILRDAVERTVSWPTPGLSSTRGGTRARTTGSDDCWSVSLLPWGQCRWVTLASGRPSSWPNCGATPVAGSLAGGSRTRRWISMRMAAGINGSSRYN